VKGLDQIVGLLDRLHSGQGETLLVPDTNALLAAPHIDKWVFDGIERFTMILVPTILAER